MAKKIVAKRAKPRRRKLTQYARSRFLKSLAETCNVQMACDVIGMSRAGMYKAKRTDQAFSEKWDEAIEEAIDSLEAECIRRGRDGVPEPVIRSRGIVYDEKGEAMVIRKYSDNCLLAALRAHRPGKWNDRLVVEGHGMVGGNVTVHLHDRTEAVAILDRILPGYESVEGVEVLAIEDKRGK